LTSLNILTETPNDLSVQNSSPFAAGPATPAFQPTIIGQNTWFQRSNTQTLTNGGALSGSSNPGTLDFVTANYALVQGFSTGTQLEIDLNNAASVLYGTQSQYNPFATPNTSITVTQPLLQGFGRDINLRFIKIAKINEKISRLLFYQQLISTVMVSRGSTMTLSR
jgi:hypothetical protein